MNSGYYTNAACIEKHRKYISADSLPYLTLMTYTFKFAEELTKK